MSTKIEIIDRKRKHARSGRRKERKGGRPMERREVNFRAFDPYLEANVC